MRYAFRSLASVSLLRRSAAFRPGCAPLARAATRGEACLGMADRRGDGVDAQSRRGTAGANVNVIKNIFGFDQISRLQPAIKLHIHDLSTFVLMADGIPGDPVATGGGRRAPRGEEQEARGVPRSQLYTDSATVGYFYGPPLRLPGCSGSSGAVLFSCVVLFSCAVYHASALAGRGTRRRGARLDLGTPPQFD